MHFFKASVPLFCLYFHIIVVTLSLANYIAFVRVQKIDSPLKMSYIAFAVIQIVAYALGAGPLFLYAYKYGKSAASRLGRLLGGIGVMFIFSSLPMVIIEMIMLLSIGEFRSSLDAIVFFLHAIAAAIGGCISWFGYMRFIATQLHKWRGPERQITEDWDHTPDKDPQLMLVRRLRDQPTTI